MIWLDVLDMPTVNHFQASFANHFDEKMQNVDHEDGDSFERYATGVLPDGEPAVMNRTPVINYPYAKMRPILERLKKTGDVDKRHGARVRYANPINGGPVLPTMGAQLALLPKGFKGEPYRRPTARCSPVAEGHGTTIVDGKPFEWGVNDVFVVPPWKRYPAQCRGRVGAVLNLRPAGAGSSRHLAREAQLNAKASVHGFSGCAASAAASLLRSRASRSQSMASTTSRTADAHASRS